MTIGIEAERLDPILIGLIKKHAQYMPDNERVNGLVWLVLLFPAHVEYDMIFSSWWIAIELAAVDWPWRMTVVCENNIVTNRWRTIEHFHFVWLGSSSL